LLTRRTTLPDDIRRALPDHGMPPSEWPSQNRQTFWQKIYLMTRAQKLPSAKCATPAFAVS
jgi:hypothetical protein